MLYVELSLINMFSYFSVNCVFNIIEYFSYLNLWLVMLFLFIMLFFFVLGSTQLMSSSSLCSDVVFETSLVLFSLFLIIMIMSPALMILLDLELIMMPSFMIYSCGVQWLWSFSLSYLNWINNCDHYVYSSYLTHSMLKQHFLFYSFWTVIGMYLTHSTFNWMSNELNTMRAKWNENFIKCQLYLERIEFNKMSFLEKTKLIQSWYCYWLTWLWFNTLLNKAFWINIVLNKAFWMERIKWITINNVLCFMLNSLDYMMPHFSMTNWLYNFGVYWINMAKWIDQSTLNLAYWISLSVLNLVKHAVYYWDYIEYKICWTKTASKNKKEKKHNKVLKSLIKSSFYLANTNELMLLPLLSTIRYYVFSYDVIHSLGIYSFGIKIDAMPGSFNFTTTIQTLIKGEHRGMCYELCFLYQ